MEHMPAVGHSDLLMLFDSGETNYTLVGGGELLLVEIG